MSEIPKFDTEYIMQIWKDELEDPDGGLLQEGTPYNEIRMMYIEKGICDAHAAVVALSLWLVDKYAAIGHTHEGIYSPLLHNHDTAYAAKTHDHDGVYATASHNHSGIYEPVISKKSGFNLDKSDSVSSASSSVLATSKAVKIAYDKGVQALNAANTAQSTANGKEPAFSKKSGFNLDKSNSVSSTSSSILATLRAVKTAYDKAVSAYNLAASKLGATSTAVNANKYKNREDIFHPDNYGNVIDVSASFTLSATHENKTIRAIPSSSMTITIPANVLTTDTQLTIIKAYNQQVTFTAGAGMTLYSLDNNRTISGLYGVVSIVFKTPKVAYLFGALE